MISKTDNTRREHELDFALINDFYVQVGADVTNQWFIQSMIGEEVAGTRYVPHLSFNGTRTSRLSLLRCYVGVLLPRDPNVYVGADYGIQDERGWSAFVAAQAYSDPERTITARSREA